MANITSTILTDPTKYLQLPAGTTAQRPGYTVIQWTNTGTQTYSVLAGATPTLTNTTWTAPAGVTQVEVLVVAGGGAGGRTDSQDGATGGGGAGGLIYNSAFTVTPTTQYTVTVGAGGAVGGGAAVAMGAGGEEGAAESGADRPTTVPSDEGAKYA